MESPAPGPGRAAANADPMSIMDPARPLVLLALFAAPTTPQCLGDDGLGGPCAGFANEILPAFPAVEFQGAAFAWERCVPRTGPAVTLRVSAPAWQACGRYLANVSVADAGASTVLAGLATLDYARTWLEVQPGGEPRTLQVYRLLLKVDLNWFLEDETLLPACLMSGGWRRAFYTGYLDLAFDCAGGAPRAALVLFHNGDAFLHAEGLSSRPGVFHPETTYALVAPATPSQPFVPSGLSVAVSHPAGALLGDAVREAPDGPGGACAHEDVLAGGQVTRLGSGCACPFALVPEQASALRLTGLGNCTGPEGTTSFRSVKTPAAFPWIHAMATSLGAWTSGAAYPGTEAVWIDEAPMLYEDPRSSGPFRLGEIYYGATTAGGFEVRTTAGEPASDRRMDLASNRSFSPANPPTTLVGSVGTTRNVIALDLP